MNPATWILMIFLASGEIAIFDAGTELRCDAEKTAIEEVASHPWACPVALAAQCVQGSVER